MSHEIMEGSDSLVMNEKDDVATVLRDMPVGERMRYRKGESAETIVLLNRKCGTEPIKGFIEYAEDIPEHGLYFMDSPGNDIECVSGMAADGVHIVCFTTGRGTPTGSAVVPVIKITGNKLTFTRMEDNMDVDVSDMLAGTLSLEQAGESCKMAVCA